MLQYLHYTQPWASEGGQKEVRHFLIKFLTTKVVFLLSSGKKDISPFLISPSGILSFPGKIH